MAKKSMYDYSESMETKIKISKKHNEKKQWTEHDIQSEEIRIRRKQKYGMLSGTNDDEK